MQSFVGKLTHACPVYYCSRSARPRALPAGLSVVAADWPHVSNPAARCDCERWHVALKRLRPLNYYQFSQALQLFMLYGVQLAIFPFANTTPYLCGDVRVPRA